MQLLSACGERDRVDAILMLGLGSGLRLVVSPLAFRFGSIKVRVGCVDVRSGLDQS